ncbi:Ferredoxin-6 [Zhongshania aliphaticivorans]|uniref:Ferredoxin-6 n=1 Tax=Zhongshania aliphaticivorans TaxID=1470434 RepID=A0A5S9PIX8_9GAMM|nr:2Fe-2S iron-sulfur cluster-binding protein [Zhongshania aliphaticivorans]CAA0104149.1 Ferredoxin-6 [Zhongshania aliphaticivorans]CAA0104324.1 Ferredoxin-6 [Zhongshania aliphaticivorans]
MTSTSKQLIQEKVTLTFYEQTGIRKIVSGMAGISLMELAKANDIAGIDGDCGGACSCGTCCVIIENSAAMNLEQVSDAELGILEFVSDDIVEGQRLACQIDVTNILEGAVIKVAT